MGIYSIIYEMYGRKKYSRRTYRRSSYGKPKTTRRYSRRRYVKSVTPHRTLWSNPLPLTHLFKFKYQDSNFDFTPSAVTGQQSNNWRVNGMYDPDSTGVGVQPYAYDNYLGANNPYQFYKVFAAKIKVVPHLISAASNVNLRFAVFASKQGVTYTGFEDVSQIPGRKLLTINSPDDQDHSLVCYCSMSKLWGKSNFSGDAFDAGYNALPARQSYFTVISDSTLNGNAATVCKVDIVITYYCQLIRADDVDES